MSPKSIKETINTALVWDIPPDITHNNSYVCMTDSSFQTHPVTEMSLLVCTIHNEPWGCDWCLFPLISFICSSRLGGAMFQGQWITHPRQGKIHTSVMGLGKLTGSFKVSWLKKEGLYESYGTGHLHKRHIQYNSTAKSGELGLPCSLTAITNMFGDLFEKYSLMKKKKALYYCYLYFLLSKF